MQLNTARPSAPPARLQPASALRHQAAISQSVQRGLQCSIAFSCTHKTRKHTLPALQGQLRTLPGAHGLPTMRGCHYAAKGHWLGNRACVTVTEALLAQALFDEVCRSSSDASKGRWLQRGQALAQDDCVARLDAPVVVLRGASALEARTRVEGQRLLVDHVHVQVGLRDGGVAASLLQQDLQQPATCRLRCASGAAGHEAGPAAATRAWPRLACRAHALPAAACETPSTAAQASRAGRDTRHLDMVPGRCRRG